VTGTRAATPAIARAYRLSVYEGGGLTIRIGRRAEGAWPFPGHAQIVLVSACNPFGRAVPAERNVRLMARSSPHLARLPYRDGVGRLGRWAEPLWLVAAAPARGMVLARQFRQNAVVVVQRGQQARLVLLAV